MPVLPVGRKMAQGSEVVVVAALSDDLPDECATGLLLPMPLLFEGDEDLDFSRRTNLLSPKSIGTLSRDAERTVLSLLLLLPSGMLD